MKRTSICHHPTTMAVTGRRIDLASLVGPELWGRHRQNRRDVLALLRKSQELASEIREIVAKATKIT